MSVEEIIIQLREIQRSDGRIFDQQFFASNEAIDNAIQLLSRPKGNWIKRNSYDRRDNFYACSECGRIINIICNAHLEDYPYCHCGADMRGETE